jgi:hypothetical protein
MNSKNKRDSNKMFMSLDNGFVNGNTSYQEDPFEILRLSH